VRRLRGALALAGLLCGAWLGFTHEPRRGGMAADTAAIYALLLDSMPRLSGFAPARVRFVRGVPERPWQFSPVHGIILEPGDVRPYLARGFDRVDPATVEAFQRAVSRTDAFGRLLPRRRVWRVGASVGGVEPLVPRILYASVHGFSHVGYNPARTQAIVYATFHCGETCGGGVYVLLQRSPRGWRIVDTLMAWIS
jgi:hypothetical protein